MQDKFCKMERDMWLSHGSYGVYAAITEFTLHLLEGMANILESQTTCHNKQISHTCWFAL